MAHERAGSTVYKGQLYDGVFGAADEAGGTVQVKRKLLGIMEEFKLLPWSGSELWKTDNLDAWMQWAETNKEPMSAAALKAVAEREAAQSAAKATSGLASGRTSSDTADAAAPQSEQPTVESTGDVAINAAAANDTVSSEATSAPAEVTASTADATATKKKGDAEAQEDDYDDFDDAAQREKAIPDHVTAQW